MSVRPTLLSISLGTILSGLIVLGLLWSQCQAAPEQTPGAAYAAGARLQLAADSAPASAAPSVKAPSSKIQPANGTPAEAAAGGSPDGNAAGQNSANSPAKSPTANISPQDTGDTGDVQSGETGAATQSEHEPYEWAAIRAESKIKLRGAVPSEDDRKTILGMVKAHFPDLAIEDSLEVKEGGPSKEQWLGAVSFALKQLTYLGRGSVKLSDAALTVTGTAEDGKDYAELRQSMNGPLPTGLSLAGEKVAPPIASPFLFQVSLKANMVTLAGYVPSDEIHKRITDATSQLFPQGTINDQLQLASGAPKSWKDAAFAALTALSHLDEGQVTLTDGALKIEGMAPDKNAAAELSYQLHRELPPVFTASENIRWKEAGTPRDVANKILPRIKEIADREGLALEGLLPPLEGSAAP